MLFQDRHIPRICSYVDGLFYISKSQCVISTAYFVVFPEGFLEKSKNKYGANIDGMTCSHLICSRLLTLAASDVITVNIDTGR